MKWLNGYRIRLVLIGFVVAVVLAAGGRAKADFTFGKPVNLGPVVNGPSADIMGCFSADGLEMYFASDRPGGRGDADIWVSTRQNVNDPWGQPANLGATANSPYGEVYPSISSEGLTLYFSDSYSSSSRPGGLGHDIWMSTRASRSAPWTAPVNVGAPINTSQCEHCPSISADGLELFLASGTPLDLYASTRADVQNRWGPPARLGGSVNSGGDDNDCTLSPDGLALFFASTRPGLGAYDLWMSTRKSQGDPWSQAVNLGPIVNSTGDDLTPGISPDMKTLYLGSARLGGLGGYDLWEARIIPVVDFNGDGMVAIEDLVRLIESWGQDDPSVDIGPGPWGDGTVDVADLQVLMSYWGQEVNDPTLVAHWKLDETEGAMAHDSAGTNDASVMGSPLWQPAAGMIGGAIQLDGVDDYVATSFVLDPSKGPLSVFAWVRGGAPGQVVLSQASGANWLMASSPDGALMADFRSARGKSLTSSVLITDGNWHRVGLAWDGSNRVLYVDDVEVARDTQIGLVASASGLYIGAGKALETGTFFSGLIDDVRIYDRAVKP